MGSCILLKETRHSDAACSQVLLEPGYVLEDDCNTQAKDLRDSGRKFYDEKYKEHFDNLFKSVGYWFKAMGDDPVCFPAESIFGPETDELWVA